MSKIPTHDILALRSPISSKRLSIRPFTKKHITTSYLSWLNDSEVLRYSNQRFRTHNKESCRAYLASFLNSTNHFMAIFIRETNEMIGTLTVYHNVHHATADIGIMIGERRIWGQGLGSEAFQLVLSILIESSVVRKITSGTLAINANMVGILSKAGMQLEAVRREHELVDSKPVDIQYYAKFC